MQNFLFLKPRFDLRISHTNLMNISNGNIYSAFILLKNYIFQLSIVAYKSVACKTVKKQYTEYSFYFFLSIVTFNLQ